MSLQTDLLFIHTLSPRLEKFHRKHDYLFNCRCPLCGDSKKNKTKMRGYLYRKNNEMFYRCYNCGISTTLGNLIKQLDDGLHREYVLERYKSGESSVHHFTEKTLKITTPKFEKMEKSISYDNAIRCDRLPTGHFCIDYLTKRQIPIDKYSLLYYTDNYKKFVDEVYPTHGKNITEDKRLVIPFYDSYDTLIAVSGRALETSDNKLRYVTIRTNESENKLIYGLDRIILSQKVLIVEGPIDSLFLNNCLASGDANLALTAKSIKAKEIVLVPDNEPRNKEILSLMKGAIRDGHKIVIWPDTMAGKDINEFVMNGMTPTEVQSIINQNTFSGIQAQLKFNLWKRI